MVRRFGVPTLFAAAGMVVAAVIMQPNIGRLDGTLFPVVGSADIELVRHEDGSTVVSARADKHRGCAWIKTEWFLGEIYGRAAAVYVEHLDKPQLRGPGTLSWGGIRIGLPWPSIQRNSYAIVTHDCFGGWLWRTQSVFYTPT